MPLVGYSDSEASENEAPAQVSKQSKPSTSTKAGFQKFTVGGNRHKIKVNLPTSSESKDDTMDDGEPAPKRAKVSGGGFNAMLPAPKRSKPALATSSRGKGLGSGINLKTGAAPGFTRDLPEIPSDEVELVEEPSVGVYDSGNRASAVIDSLDAEHQNTEPSKPVGNAMKFKPLSVSRRPKKKSAAALMAAIPTTSLPVPKPSPPKPKVSLFSTTTAEDDYLTNVSSGDYKPMIYSTTSETASEVKEDLRDPLYTSNSPEQSRPHNSQAQSLSTIADSLNLSASQRRQLMGRKGANLAAANVVEFNTETEYAANEELRARGETTTFNPVRSVASGKHSLQQLVNLVSNQKEALEESFAAGKRNKKEAGAKYGW